ncbi:hypothetical protein HDU87_001906, partial [Geranomyces variabilis]
MSVAALVTCSVLPMIFRTEKLKSEYVNVQGPAIPHSELGKLFALKYVELDKLHPDLLTDTGCGQPTGMP